MSYNISTTNIYQEDLLVNRIKELRNVKQIKQIDLCKKLGVTQGALSSWENEKYEPDINSLKKLSEFFNVSIDYLLGRSDTSSTHDSHGIRIPVLGKIVAGIPIEAVEEILDYEEITPELASSGEYFALRIKGNSMEPKISEGDVIIVRKQDYADNGDTAIVLVNGDEATVKKIRKSPDGISLIPNNPSYDIIFYSNKEIEDLPVRIIGKVIELRAKF